MSAKQGDIIKKLLYLMLAMSLLLAPFSLALSADDIINFKIQIPHPDFVKTTGQVSIWLILVVFLFLFSLLYVLVKKLPVFKDNKKPMIGFSVAIALICILGSSIVEIIAQYTSAFSNILILAIFVLLGIFTWFILSSGYSAGREMAATAGAAAHNAGTAAKKANQEETKAHRDLEREKHIIQKEKRDIAQAEHEMHNMSVATHDEIGALKNLQKILKHLVSAADEGEVKRLKDMYGRQVAALNSMIIHENEAINHYRQKIHDLKNLGHDLYRGEDTMANIANRINAAAITRHGAGHTHGPRINHLALRAEKLIKEQNAIIKEIEEEIQKIKAEDQKVVDNIQNTTHGLYAGHYQQGLHHIQEAIRVKENVSKETQRLHNWDARITKLTSEVNAIDREIAALLR